ncbi:MarR family winged helix-turn-helix transcriptional regulator [Paenibacillus ferrarius]|uniref:MarR family winged helix-turn-helix transcriptional regulator n=1 Tax=Paenibacillus ferrarius TaxID=1469647 RepID=UPI003D2933A8
MEDELISYTNRFRTAYEIAHRKIHQAVFAELETELTPPQLFLLAMIHKQGTPKQSHLAELMGVKPSAITVMIDRLVQSGHVARLQHETDRRIVLVEVSEKGKRMFDQASEVTRNVMERGLRQLSKEELHTMVTAFEKFTATY